MNNQYNTQTVIMCIDKGGQKIYDHLITIFPNTFLLEVPEPVNGFNNGITKLKQAILKKKPKLLVAGSRGGKYVANLLSTKAWTGPTLLFGAMSTSEATSKCNNCSLLLIHGTKDTLNPIFRVRNEVETSSSTLEEIKGGGHILSFSNTEMKRIINKALKLKPKKVNRKLMQNPIQNPFALLKAIQKQQINE